jgi:hypothetical protein
VKLSTMCVWASSSVGLLPLFWRWNFLTGIKSWEWCFQGPGSLLVLQLWVTNLCSNLVHHYLFSAIMGKQWNMM